ncbi:hypothetical protein [Prevotella sp. AGR2160]|uniref:hypothetical protein n=1 Tax=Prevotella sp. AGR2160 TaxID=1280674 RepID=UPI00048E68D0|nr:hypothetical protein [Prevotella sp. AGR2160]
MKNFYEMLKKRIQIWHEEHAEKIEAQRQAELDAEARSKIQVMEFNGNLYVCVYGIPLFGEDDIKDTFAKAVENGRKNFKDWQEEKLWEQ